MGIVLIITIVGVSFCYGWGTLINKIFDRDHTWKDALEKEIDSKARTTMVGSVIKKTYDGKEQQCSTTTHKK